MEISQPLQIRLPVPLVALLKLSGELCLDGVRPIPCLQPLPVGLILDLNIGQSGQRGLKLSQKIVRIAGCLWCRHKRS
jgi:hypothetical protein